MNMKMCSVVVTLKFITPIERIRIIDHLWGFLIISAFIIIAFDRDGFDVVCVGKKRTHTHTQTLHCFRHTLPNWMFGRFVCASVSMWENVLFFLLFVCRSELHTARFNVSQTLNKKSCHSVERKGKRERKIKNWFFFKENVVNYWSIETS